MNEQTNNTQETRTQNADAPRQPKAMRYGRAMKLDLSRASDEVLAEAYRVLDEYDTQGHASAWVQEAIDERLAAIDDEGDRRAGIEPVYVPRQPSAREVWEASMKAGERADETADDAQDDAQPGEGEQSALTLQ